MKNFGGFDLSSYDDVKSNAAAIVGRLDDRTMPCDGEWPDSNIELFRKWMEGGYAA